MEFRRLIVALAITQFSLSAHAGKGHVHGAGSVDIGIEQGRITVSLDLPLDAAVGFERAPKTDREKADLSATEKALNDAERLFVPTPAAKCSIESKRVTVPFTDGKPANSGDAHADIEAEYVYRCAEPAALKGIETSVFQHFKRLYRLDVRRVGPQGQAAGRLTPKQPTLTW